MTSSAATASRSKTSKAGYSIPAGRAFSVTSKSLSASTNPTPSPRGTLSPTSAISPAPPSSSFFKSGSKSARSTPATSHSPPPSAPASAPNFFSYNGPERHCLPCAAARRRGAPHYRASRFAQSSARHGAARCCPRQRAAIPLAGCGPHIGSDRCCRRSCRTETPVHSRPRCTDVRHLRRCEFRAALGHSNARQSLERPDNGFHQRRRHYLRPFPFRPPSKLHGGHRGADHASSYSHRMDHLDRRHARLPQCDLATHPARRTRTPRQPRLPRRHVRQTPLPPRPLLAFLSCCLSVAA